MTIDIPLVYLSNNNIFFETYLIFLGVLLAKIFSEELENLARLYNKNKTFKTYLNKSAKYFQRKYNICQFFFSLKFVIVFWILFIIFGYQKAFAVSIVALFDPIIQEGFALFKQNRIYFSVVFCLCNFLIVAMLLTANIFEKIVILLLGLTIYSLVKFIDFLKTRQQKKHKQKFYLFKK